MQERANINFIVHEDDHAIIEDGESEEEDVEMPDFDIHQEHMAEIDEANQEKHEDQANQRHNDEPLRILQGARLRILGEGRVHFLTSVVVSNHFHEYKTRMKQPDDVELPNVDEPREPESAISSTPIKKGIKGKELDRLKRNVERETRYNFFLQLKDTISPEALEEVKMAVEIPKTTERRIEERRANHLPVTGRRRGRVPVLK